MRQTEHLTNVVLRQNANGEYWLDFKSIKGAASIGLSRGSTESTERTKLEAWAETQFADKDHTARGE